MSFYPNVMLRRFKHSVPDFYAILGVDYLCSTKEIKQAYYLKAKIYHPDSNFVSYDKCSGHKEFSELTIAYKVKACKL